MYIVALFLYINAINSYFLIAALTSFSGFSFYVGKLHPFLNFVVGLLSTIMFCYRQSHLGKRPEGYPPVPRGLVL